MNVFTIKKWQMFEAVYMLNHYTMYKYVKHQNDVPFKFTNFVFMYQLKIEVLQVKHYEQMIYIQKNYPSKNG